MTNPLIVNQIPAGQKLSKGGGKDITDACLMQVVSYVAGERRTDRPKCACPVISAFGRQINDRLTDPPRTDLLLPFVARIVGSKSTPEVELKRAFVAADFAVRVFAPAALEARGRGASAATLRALSPIVDVKTALIAQKAAYATATAAAAYAADAAYAAAYAADAAAYAATAAAAYATADAAAYATADAAATTDIENCLNAMLAVTP